jgi:hypothetical protein
LWFICQYEFGLTEEKFWSLTPRQLNTYTSEYISYQEAKNNTSEDHTSDTGETKKQPEQVYIDQIW